MEFAIWALVFIAACNQVVLLWLHVKMHRQWERQHAANQARHSEWMDWNMTKDQGVARERHLERVLKKHHDARYSKTDPGDECGACQSELSWPFGGGKIREDQNDDEG